MNGVGDETASQFSFALPSDFLAFLEVRSLLPMFNRCSMRTLPFADVVFMYL